MYRAAADAYTATPITPQHKGQADEEQAEAEPSSRHPTEPRLEDGGRSLHSVTGPDVLEGQHEMHLFSQLAAAPWATPKAFSRYP